MKLMGTRLWIMTWWNEADKDGLRPSPKSGPSEATHKYNDLWLFAHSRRAAGSEISKLQIFSNGSNLSANRPLNRRARRATTGKQLAESFSFRLVNLDGRI